MVVLLGKSTALEHLTKDYYIDKLINKLIPLKPKNLD